MTIFSTIDYYMELPIEARDALVNKILGLGVATLLTLSVICVTALIYYVVSPRFNDPNYVPQRSMMDNENDI